VILLAGINDIGFGARAPDLIAGQRRMIARAHARGIRIYGGTLTPFRGSHPRGHGEAGEAARQAVNGWIRTGAPFDGVIDFDAALRDPDHLDRLRPRYDSGDHVHLNRAGFRRMAQIVQLQKLIAP
jgi:lysophospholipase L1-like esterase